MAHHGRADEEMFMNKPSDDCDSPTVEPLRIFRPQSPPDAGMQIHGGADRYRYPSPASSSSKPTFPLPPGASSSAAPLPYPDDDDLRPSGQPAPNDTTPRLDTTSPIDSSRPGLAERRGNKPRPLPGALSPTSPGPTSDTDSGLFAKPLANNQHPPPPAHPASTSINFPDYRNKPYYPPPGGASTGVPQQQYQQPQHQPQQQQQQYLGMPENGVNRFASTASTSTTRASRGSPPPPETPIVEPGNVPGGGIEARYAAAGISGTETLTSLQSAAAQQRLAQYGQQQQHPALRQQQAQHQPEQQQQPSRPWTPTEQPGQQPHGPPTIYQGAEPVGSPMQSSFGVQQQQQQQQQQYPHPVHTPSPAPNGNVIGTPNSSQSGSVSNNANNNGEAAGPELQVSVLEQDFQRMQMSPSPPPAYSSINPGGNSSAYGNEKGRTGPPASAANQQSTAGTAGGVAQGGRPHASSASSMSSPQNRKQTELAMAAGLASPALQHQGHPAFANDPRPDSAAGPSQPFQQPQQQQQQQQQQQPQQLQQQQQQQPQDPQKSQIMAQQLQINTPSPFAAGQGPTSPPPLPEGWIAHLDQTSGQYYYIHLATQATQWEFPMGPNPKMAQDIAPLSPGAASTYGNPLASPSLYGSGKQGVASMASPMFPPQTPGYAESIMSVAASATPTAAGFSGPPPGAGVDMYKVQPTNGVYFGPYLRYVNMDLEKGVWLGSIMIVSDGPQPPTIHLHKSVDLSPNPQQLQPRVIHTHQRWQFYKYDVAIQMDEKATTERWTYAVTSHLGCTRYEFVVAGRNETAWRFVCHSGNDFAATTSQAERAKLGGLGFMWNDLLQKNVDCGGFHVQLGLGDQIYGDRLWKEVPLLKQWLAMQGKDNRQKAQWTARHEEDVTHAYFHFYTSHFDQPFLREAFAQIPHICQIDDHDIFDGFGSYPDYMQNSQMFKNIGRIAIDMYLLFQHHSTLEQLRHVSHDLDLFTVTGQGWHFVKYLGPAVAVVGADLRSERSSARVMAGPTYQGLFPKVAMLPPSVQHCIFMLSVPPIYPRLDTVESLANTFATGKKAVNTTYNVLGKVTSSVAGIVGGKEIVAGGFSSVKKAVGKSGLMGNVVNQFGDLDISEVLKDMWTHESKDLERTYLIRTLQGISQQKGLRMTFFSGDVNAAGAGLVHDPSHPGDHKTMYQVITSPIVAAPAAGYVLKMLHSSRENRACYVPLNGQKSTHEVSDTKEDMMEIFHTEASGGPRELKKLMGRRNYIAVVAYDPDPAGTAAQQQVLMGGGGGGSNGSLHGSGGDPSLTKLNLAIDFVVQGDGAFTQPTKYGPVIVPHLEFGR